MNVRNFYGIKNWAAISGGENGESENKFLGESDSDDEYVYCESNYNNPQSEESEEESIQNTEKKNFQQVQLRLDRYCSIFYFFLDKFLH